MNEFPTEITVVEDDLEAMTRKAETYLVKQWRLHADAICRSPLHCCSVDTVAYAKETAIRNLLNSLRRYVKVSEPDPYHRRVAAMIDLPYIHDKALVAVERQLEGFRTQLSNEMFRGKQHREEIRTLREELATPWWKKLWKRWQS